MHVFTSAMASILVLLKPCHLSRLQLNILVTCAHSVLRYGIADGGYTSFSPDLAVEPCVGILGMLLLDFLNNSGVQPSGVTEKCIAIVLSFEIVGFSLFHRKRKFLMANILR